jgi:hypothetical protein
MEAPGNVTSPKENRVAQNTEAVLSEKSALNESVLHETVDLKDSTLAALLAWLVPGAGHFYQGRHAKGALLLVCILGTFIYGMILGHGRCVYFQWEPSNMRRFSYVCQLGAGLLSLPALVGTARANQGAASLPGLSENYYMPPRPVGPNGEVYSYEAWSAPGASLDTSRSEYDQWSSAWHRGFELGTVFTMIAGLLNILAVYDAWRGPAFEMAGLGAARPGEKPPAG